MANPLMTKTLFFSLAALLAGCASPQNQPELNRLNNQVGKLNSEMRQLTRQATALEQQNSLNLNASQGAWLLPATNAAVLLKSQAGEVRLSLSHVESEANGTRATLHVRTAGDKPLPGFSAQIEWGEMDKTTGRPLQASSQTQKVSVRESLLPRSEIAIPLRLSNFTPQQLGYVRVHDIVVNAPAPATIQP
ncbi:DUF3251 domain-containing protein [Erwinia sp. P6884]|uniref:DUF3251 domain-containing protein n=1 Tax=Erwinia sp. P6884 TaxID=3141450 RepID=UPI00318F9062